jgi:SAM-dependent methyltransferase
VSDPASPHDTAALAEAYARRQGAATRAHGFLLDDVLHRLQERQRVMVRLMRELGWTDLSQRKVLEVGCGAGGNLLELLRMGFMPRNLRGIELLQERYDHACEVLPSALRLIHGDALGDEAQRVIPPASQDMVLAFTVFSSVLDAGAQALLADAMWRWVRPGGGVLWYDFTVNNPRNPDVKGVPVERIRELFPLAQLHVRPLTVAPPVARWAAHRHPAWLNLAAQLPWLRTHVLVWAQKPLEPPSPSVTLA